MVFTFETHADKSMSAIFMGDLMMNILKNMFCITAIAGGLLASGQVFADDHGHEHQDVVLAAQGGQVVTLSEHDGAFEKTRIYGAGLSVANSGSQPGFGAIGGGIPGFDALPGLADVSFTITAATLGDTTANLFYWDGTGAAAFESAAGAGSMQVLLGSGLAIADGGANNVDGFVFTTSSNDGAVHMHLNYFMPDNPAAGVYVLPMSLSVEGLADSKPVFLVLATQGVDEAQHEAAIHAVTAAIPEPASAVLLLVSGLGLACVRRRA